MTRRLLTIQSCLYRYCMWKGQAKQGLTQASESSSETCLSLFLRKVSANGVCFARKGTVHARRLARTVPFLLCPQTARR